MMGQPGGFGISVGMISLSFDGNNSRCKDVSLCYVRKLLFFEASNSMILHVYRATMTQPVQKTWRSINGNRNIHLHCDNIVTLFNLSECRINARSNASAVISPKGLSPNPCLPIRKPLSRKGRSPIGDGECKMPSTYYSLGSPSHTVLRGRSCCQTVELDVETLHKK